MHVGTSTSKRAYAAIVATQKPVSQASKGLSRVAVSLWIRFRRSRALWRARVTRTALKTWRGRREGNLRVRTSVAQRWLNVLCCCVQQFQQLPPTGHEGGDVGVTHEHQFQVVRGAGTNFPHYHYPPGRPKGVVYRWFRGRLHDTMQRNTTPSLRVK